jgi:hypothetical protein
MVKASSWQSVHSDDPANLENTLVIFFKFFFVLSFLERISLHSSGWL